jgi:hypothetical protein
MLEYNKVYEFDLAGKVKFGDLPTELIHEMFKDGRVASKFMEHHLPIWFPELEFVDAKGYDHVRTTDGRRFDLKSFTKGGTTYAPSVMVGAGREIDEQKLHAHAETIDYVLSDITEFPRVRIKCIPGRDLVRDYPAGHISVAKKQLIFG